MKRPILGYTLSCLLLFMGCGHRQSIKINPNEKTSISFVDTLVDLGHFDNVKEEIQKCNFEFTNTGNNPLVIYKVEPSCHCTTVDYPHEPIEAGDVGKLKLTIDAGIGHGDVRYTVLVYTNTKDSPRKLIVQGFIDN